VTVERQLPAREHPAEAKPNVVVVFLADLDSRVDHAALASVAEPRARHTPYCRSSTPA
jgi:hypothetical protein